MMDFGPPPKREPQYTPRTNQQQPVATVPPPAPKPAEAPGEQKPKRKRRIKKAGAHRRWIKLLVILLAVGLIAWLAYGYITTRNQLMNASAGKAGGSAQTETQKLVNQVSQHVDLPNGETPTIATVNDASKLKNQAFFAAAKNGDKVLIFSKSGKAVLYRPSTDRVVEYSTVNLSGSSTN